MLVGSGTAALIAILKILVKRDRGTVAIPVNVCPNVVTAIYAAGKMPIYLDIEEGTCRMESDELERLEQKPGAVIAVHSYGTPCKIEIIQNICNEHGIYLIEDAAVAQGAISEKQGEQVLNLWVNDEVDDGKVERYANKLIDIYERTEN